MEPIYADFINSVNPHCFSPFPCKPVALMAGLWGSHPSVEVPVKVFTVSAPLNPHATSEVYVIDHPVWLFGVSKFMWEL